MVVNVGMGSGDSNQKREALMLMGQLQRELMASGSRMVNDKNVFNTAESVMETFGMNSIGRYMNDPEKLPPEPPKQEQPNPSLELARAQIQNMEQETIRRASEADAKNEIERDKLEQKARELDIKERELELRDSKAASDIQTDEERLELDREKAVMDDDFKRDKLEIDALTGFKRDNPQEVTSAPPIDYSGVLK
jgi:hypothetical protein